MKKNIKYLVLFLFLNFVFSVPVTLDRVLYVAENFYFHKNNPRDSEFTYSNFDTFTKDNENIFLIINCRIVINKT